MPKKETVVVFKGEDKFIAKKKRVYDKNKGESEFVGIVEGPKPTLVAVDDAGGGATAEMPVRIPEVPVDNPPPPPVEPYKAPDWSTMGCDDIDAELNRLREFLMVARIPAEIYSQYEAAIASGEAAKVEKCGKTPPALPDVPPPPPPPPPPPTPVGLGLPPRAGGGAAAPAGGGAKKEEAKPNLLIWILLALAGIYLLSDKK